MFKAWVRSCALAIAVVAVGAGSALAQSELPSRSIKIVVPFAAGGGVDTVARLVGEEFKHSLGQVAGCRRASDFPPSGSAPSPGLR